MKIRWHTPYQDNGVRYPDPVWPEDWPIPFVLSSINTEAKTLWVRGVHFFPYGEADDNEPFVYIVLETRV